MITLLGIGSAGASVVDAITFGDEVCLIGDDQAYNWPKHLTPHQKIDTELEPEKIEKEFEFDVQIKGGDTIYVVFSTTSACFPVVLKTLEALNEKSEEIILLLIKSEFLDLLTQSEKVVEDSVVDVVQSITRSGGNNVNECILIDNDKVPIFEEEEGDYYELINNKISYVLNLYEKYRKQKPVLGHLTRQKDNPSKLITLGVYNLDKDEEKLFYDLKLVREKIFYFIANRDTISRNKDVRRKILNSLKGKKADVNQKLMYGLFLDKIRKDSEDVLCFVCFKSSAIQSKKFLNTFYSK